MSTELYSPDRIIILNGPPGCGKDFAATVIGHRIPFVRVRAFKTHLISITAQLFRVDEEEFFEMCADRTTKDAFNPRLRGLSPREALIFVSETVVKPNFGKEYFGYTEVESLVRDPDCHGRHIVYSDGGFLPEILTLAERFGYKNILVVRIHAEGKSFRGDSRSYLSPSSIRSCDIYNDFTEEFAVRIQVLAEDFFDWGRVPEDELD